MGLQRLLVPLDPWRYYELGRVAERPFHGRCLDVSSPKLLMSLLQHEGRGDWTGIDLFSAEIKSWRAVDPSLRLEVQDATSLDFPDESFDRCICISVIEHVPGDGDAKAMEEMWRVLKPGGVLHLTTNVALKARDVFANERIYGEAQESGDEGVFFERQYSPATLEERLLRLPWQVETQEFARQKDESVEERFYARVPWSYLYGGLLRLRCARPGSERVDPSGEPVTPRGLKWATSRASQALVERGIAPPWSMSREECQACWASRAHGDNEPSSYATKRTEIVDFLNDFLEP